MARGMTAAFEEAGFTFTDADNALLIAHTKYFNDPSATVEKFERIVAMSLAEMGKRGHADDVQEDQPPLADLSRPMPGGGHSLDAADRGHEELASARQPDASGEGHDDTVQQDQDRCAPPARSPTAESGQATSVQQDQPSYANLRHPIASGTAIDQLPNRATIAVPPAREPSSADWNRRIGHTTAISDSIFNKWKIGGKPFGDVRPSELVRIERTGLSDAIAARLTRKLGVFPTDEPLRLQMSEKLAKDIQTRVNAELQSRSLQKSMKALANE